MNENTPKRTSLRAVSDWLGNLFGRRPSQIAISVIAAVIIWFAIAVNVYPSTPVRFNQVPLEVELRGTAAEANGLSMVSCDVDAVNIELTGNRSQVGQLSEDDLIAYADLGNISTPGEYTLSLSVRTERGISFNVDEISPSHATVRLDKIETRSFPAEPSYPNIRVTAGHVMEQEDVTCEPASIDITGPSAQLDKIGRVVVYSDKSQEIESSYSFSSREVKLYTDDNAELDKSPFDIPVVDFQISIPVLTQKELALSYVLRGAPAGFDADWLRERMHFSEETITLASSASGAFTNLNEWNVGYVALTDVGLNYSGTFDIELDEQYINRSGIEQVTLTLDSEGLDTRTFTVSRDNISIINAPSSYNFEIVTKQLTVTVVGPEEELDELEPSDIIVTVDLSNYNVEQASSFTQSSLISFYNESRLWAVGSYRIALNSEELGASLS